MARGRGGKTGGGGKSSGGGTSAPPVQITRYG